MFSQSRQNHHGFHASRRICSVQDAGARADRTEGSCAPLKAGLKSRAGSSLPHIACPPILRTSAGRRQFYSQNVAQIVDVVREIIIDGEILVPADGVEAV